MVGGGDRAEQRELQRTKEGAKGRKGREPKGEKKGGVPVLRKNLLEGKEKRGRQKGGPHLGF